MHRCDWRRPVRAARWHTGARAVLACLIAALALPLGARAQPAPPAPAQVPLAPPLRDLANGNPSLDPATDDGPAAAAEEHFTPLIMTALAPDPIPVTGTDAKVHLAYELTVLNDSPRPATITQVESLADGAQGRVVGSVSGPQVVARSLPVGDYPLPPVPVTTVPPGGTVILILDDVFDAREAVPAAVVHRVEATFGPIKPNQGEFAHDFPEQVSQVGGSVRVGTGRPVVIGPPLAGDDWVAVNACCELSPHRGAMVPIGGRINGAERYAVDWSRFDLSARPIVDLAKGTQADFRGDPTRNESYFSFDQPVLAVADATALGVRKISRRTGVAHTTSSRYRASVDHGTRWGLAWPKLPSKEPET
jgi:hypothetical protein